MVIYVNRYINLYTNETNFEKKKNNFLQLPINRIEMYKIDEAIGVGFYEAHDNSSTMDQLHAE